MAPKKGYDLSLTKTISEAVKVPVIASGGVGEPAHMSDGIIKGKASAVLVASIFHFGQYTINETKEAMKKAGIPGTSLNLLCPFFPGFQSIIPKGCNIFLALFCNYIATWV